MRQGYVEWAELRSQVRGQLRECSSCAYLHDRERVGWERELAPMRRAYRVRTLARRRRR